MTALDYLKTVRDFCKLNTMEGNKCGIASTSELKRWFVNKAVIVNGKAVIDFNSEVKFPIGSLTLFPKHPISLWFDDEVVYWDCFVYVSRIFGSKEKLSDIEDILDVKFSEDNGAVIYFIIASLPYSKLQKLQKLIY